MMITMIYIHKIYINFTYINTYIHTYVHHYSIDDVLFSVSLQWLSKAIYSLYGTHI